MEGLNTDEEIAHVDRHVKKTVFCLEILHKKWKCIILFMLIVILLLDITKMILPSLSADELQELSKTIYRSVKKIGTLISTQNNVSNSDPQIASTTHTTNFQTSSTITSVPILTTTTPLLEYISSTDVLEEITSNYISDEEY